MQNFVALHPPKAGRGAAAEDWHADGRVVDLIDTFSSFHPKLIEVCRYEAPPPFPSLSIVS
jgi:salicylate hydroxylase